MMIFGDKQPINQEEASSTQKFPPTIIFFQPNAGFYEFSIYSNEWVPFYQSLGVNIFLWNYRGYGESKGIPSPQQIISDGEYIVDYLRQQENISLLGAHGQSMGGMAACSVAASKNLDFLCCDRTFSCISDIALYSMPKFFKILLRLFTSYDVWSPQSYVNTSCFKILTFDFRDNIIPLMASLKIGVTKQVAQNLMNNNFDKYHQQFNESAFKNIKGFWKKTWKQDPTIHNAVQYFLLDEKDQRSLFDSLVRIINLVKIALLKGKDEKIENNKQKNIEDKGKNVRLSQFGGSSFLLKQSYSNFDSTIDYGSILNGSLLLEGIKDDDAILTKTSLQKSDSQELSELNPQIFSEYQYNNNKKKKMKKIQPKQQIQFGYISFWKDSYKTNEKLLKFFKSIFSLFDSYDAGGLTLIDAFCLFKSQESFHIFQLFLLNLTIWGSFLPLNQIIKKNFNGTLPQKYALVNLLLFQFLKTISLISVVQAKTKEIAKKLRKIAAKNQQINGIPEEFLQNIIGDLKAIADKFAILKDKLTVFDQFRGDKLPNSMINSNKEINEQNGQNAISKQEEIPINYDQFDDSNKSNKNANKSEDIDMNTKDLTHQKVLCTNEQGGITSQIIQQSNSHQEKNQNKRIAVEGEIKKYSNLKEDPQFIKPLEQLDLSKQVGNLLPLSCGHNGYLQDFEKEIFFFYLKNSSFLTEV